MMNAKDITRQAYTGVRHGASGPQLRPGILATTLNGIN